MVWIEKHKMVLIVGAIVILAGILFLGKSGSDPQSAGMSPPAETPASILEGEDTGKSYEELPEKIFVDIKGAVHAPGLYEAEENERILAMIERAGGLLPSADEKQINLAQRVSDEMVIYIPQKGEMNEDVTAVFQESASGGEKQGKVNINRADPAELQNIPGIGPAKATAIIEYRDQNGPYQQPEDLMNVSGIGEKTYEKLKESITTR